MQEDYHNIEKENHDNPVQPAQLGKGQKIAVFVLAVFAVLAIGMWMVQFKKSITGPFDYKSAGTQKETQNFASLRQEEDSEDALRDKDTDSDGLSDWDELYFYKTSPYLEDSDSDGFSDKQEIDSENDPNCPVGRDCYGVETIEESDTNLNNINNLDNLNLSAPSDSQLNINNKEPLQNILGGQLDAATLRQMLLEAGMEQKILSQFSDEELVKEWEKTFSGAPQ